MHYYIQKLKGVVYALEFKYKESYDIKTVIAAYPYLLGGHEVRTAKHVFNLVAAMHDFHTHAG